MPRTFSPADPAIVRLIRDRYHYIDTVRVYLARCPTEAEIAYLDSTCGSLKDWKPMPHQRGRWPLGGCVHQPTRASLEFLRDAFPRHLLTRIDVSLDLIVDSLANAEAVQSYVHRHFVQAWHSHEMRLFKGTTYSGPSGARNNLVIYAGKLSKITGQQCCHLEWRTIGASAMRAAGFSSIDDIFAFDPYSFWQHRMRLFKLPEADDDLLALGLLLEGRLPRPGPRSARELPERTRTRLMRSAAQVLRGSVALGASGATAQGAMDFATERLRGLGRPGRAALAGCFSMIDNACLLGTGP